MEFKIKKEEKSALPRKEVIADLIYEGTTPSRAEIKQKISAKIKSKPELTIVKTIKPAYGENRAVVTVYVYDNVDAMNSIEYAGVVTKSIPPKKEEKKAEEKPAEAPAPEKKEEAKKEEPKKEETAPAEKKEEPKEEPKAEEKKEGEQ